MTTESLRLGGVPEHFNCPWHLAIASAELADIAMDWIEQPAGTGQMIEGLAEGELDLVSILTEGTVAAIADGLEATILQVYVSSPLQWGLFVPGTSSAQTEADVGGRRLAISRPGSGSHLMAYVLASRLGVTLDDNQFVVTGGLEGTRTAFAADNADVLLWDQYMTAPLVASGEFRQLSVVPTPWPAFVIAVRNEVLASRTTEVGRIVDAVVSEATRFHSHNGVVDLLAVRYGLDNATVEGWLATTTFAERSSMPAAVVDQVLETLRDAGFRS